MQTTLRLCAGDYHNSEQQQHAPTSVAHCYRNGTPKTVYFNVKLQLYTLCSFMYLIHTHNGIYDIENVKKNLNIKAARK